MNASPVQDPARDVAATWYERKVLPGLLDFGCGLPPIARLRRLVVPQAAGQVLEVGMGTGLNLRHYDRSRLQRLVGIDPAPQMHPKALRRSRRHGIEVELQALRAEQLPFGDACFDCVVCTYALCSIADPAQALAEMRRVLKPQGRLLLAEHGLAPDAAVQRWQRRLEPWWAKAAGGCHLTRDVPALLREAGFVYELQQAYVAWPRSLAYNFWGEAKLRAA